MEVYVLDHRKLADELLEYLFNKDKFSDDEIADIFSYIRGEGCTYNENHQLFCINCKISGKAK